ncbi:glycosyltransferase family 39 protein, partial [Candidatus Gottesmanbacteria bacterium]|nr:glycosyltransferase family 39 protein [Candidatus Gottesmanbacteria bacterium]
MKLSSIILFITIIYTVLFFSHALFLQKTVYGDGIFYYSWVRSIVVDRDIDFTNDYARFGVTAPVTPIKVLGNKHPIGAPLFWFPWYAQARTVLQGTGFELSYHLLVGMFSVLAALTGLVLLFRLLTQNFSQNASLLAIMSIAGASNLLFYGGLDPVNSHAVSFFAATVFLSFLFSKTVSPFITGCALGFCALVRPQDAILGLLAIPSLKRSHLLRLKSITLVIVGAILIFSPQLLTWYMLYGNAWTSPYLSGGESFSLWPAHLLDVL